jgi:phosphosulfolactate phosphohydrolase-like enzyme
MNNPFEHRRPTELEDNAHAEAVRHFAEHLKQFPASREAVERLERDADKIALAANRAATKPTRKENVIQADDGKQWHKNADLMEDIYFCHRPISYGAEYAVVEHFPARGANEI